MVSRLPTRCVAQAVLWRPGSFEGAATKHRSLFFAPVLPPLVAAAVAPAQADPLYARASIAVADAPGRGMTGGGGFCIAPTSGSVCDEEGGGCTSQDAQSVTGKATNAGRSHAAGGRRHAGTEILTEE